MADEAKVAQEPAEDTFEDFERARQEYLDPSNENRSLSAGVDETADQEEPTELEDLGAETPDDGTSGQETEETPPATETPEPEAKSNKALEASVTGLSGRQDNSDKRIDALEARIKALETP